LWDKIEIVTNEQIREAKREMDIEMWD
jgi:hypothetical protein